MDFFFLLIVIASTNLFFFSLFSACLPACLLAAFLCLYEFFPLHSLFFFFLCRCDVVLILPKKKPTNFLHIFHGCIFFVCRYCCCYQFGASKCVYIFEPNNNNKHHIHGNIFLRSLQRLYSAFPFFGWLVLLPLLNCCCCLAAYVHKHGECFVYNFCCFFSLCFVPIICIHTFLSFSSTLTLSTCCIFFLPHTRCLSYPPTASF